MGNSVEVEVEADDDDHGEAIVAVVVADPEDYVADNEEDVDDVVVAVVAVVSALPYVRACWTELVVLPFLLHSPRIVPESSLVLLHSLRILRAPPTLSLWRHLDPHP